MIAAISAYQFARPGLAIFGVALAIRLLNLALLPLDPGHLLIGDAPLYWQGALDSLMAGDFVTGSGTQAAPEVDRMPFYFAWLALFQWLFGPVFLPVLIGQALLDSGTCLIIAATARQVDARLFLPGGFVAAVWPNLWLHSGQLLTDSVFLFFFAASLYGLVVAQQNGRWQDVLLAGLALGCATMTRPVTYALLPAAALGLLALQFVSTRDWRRAGLSFVLLLGSGLLVVSPILVRNVTQFGTWSLTSQNGTHLHLWVATEVLAMTQGIPRGEAVLIAYRDADVLAQAEGYPNVVETPPFARSRIHSRAAIEKLRSTPIGVLMRAWAQGAAINLAAPALLIDNRVQALPHTSFMDGTQGGLWVRTWAFIAGSSPAYVTAFLFGFGLAIPAMLLQAAGCWLHLRASPLTAGAAILIVVYFLAVNGPIASPKYRLPIEPVLIIWTALALVESLRWLRAAKSR